MCDLIDNKLISTMSPQHLELAAARPHGASSSSVSPRRLSAPVIDVDLSGLLSCDSCRKPLLVGELYCSYKCMMKTRVNSRTFLQPASHIVGCFWRPVPSRPNL
jgi:hypothetical protein